MNTMKTTLEPSSYYMNTHTGSIATGADWMADQAEDGWPAEELKTLVEVEAIAWSEAGEGFILDQYREYSTYDLDIAEDEILRECLAAVGEHVVEIPGRETKSGTPYIVDIPSYDRHSLFEWSEVEEL